MTKITDLDVGPFLTDLESHLADHNKSDYESKKEEIDTLFSIIENFQSLSEQHPAKIHPAHRALSCLLVIAHSVLSERSVALGRHMKEIHDSFNKETCLHSLQRRLEMYSRALRGV